MWHRVIPVAFLIAAGSTQLEGQKAALQTMRDSVNRGDARAYASVYSPSATISIFGGGELRGRSAIEQHEVELLQQFPKARFEFYDVWHGGSQVVAHYAVNAPTAAGPSMGHEGLLFFTFNAAGEIERENRYQDSLTPMAQLGALGNAPRRPLPKLTADWRSHESGGANERRNVATARRLLTAVDEHRHAEVTSLLAANPAIDELMLADTFAGAQGSRQWFDALGAFAGSTFNLATVIAAGRYVLLEGVLSGRLTAPFGLVKSSSRQFSVHRAAVLEFDDAGRVVSIKAFMNGKELAASVGQWPIR